MSERPTNDPIRLIVEDYLDGAGYDRTEHHSDLFRVPLQMDQYQYAKLSYLCQVLSAPGKDFSRRLFQAALDLAMDEYSRFSGKNQLQMMAEMDRVLKELRRRGTFDRGPGGEEKPSAG